LKYYYKNLIKNILLIELNIKMQYNKRGGTEDQRGGRGGRGGRG
jgi:hypothetical protein